MVARAHDAADDDRRIAGLVNGWVRVKLYKGNVIVVGRDSKSIRCSIPTVATFEDDRGAYDQKDAAGFIKLNALRLRAQGPPPEES